MSTSLQNFCKCLERVVGLSEVSAEWRRELGTEWPWARLLLRATDQHADSYPKLDDAPASAARFRIVWRDEAADMYVGTDGTDSIKLHGADLVVYELDRRALAERVASAMGLVFDFALLDDPAHVCRVGAYSRLGINQAWAYFSFPPGPGELGVALASFAARHDGPFVVLTPTRSAWLGGHQTLRRDSALVALGEVVELDDVGTFRATPAVARLFERLCPRSAGGEKPVFGRCGKGRLLVYDHETSIAEETKGCEYIAYLLAHPGVVRHAGELQAAATGAEELEKLARDRGDKVFDAVGWQELRERSRELLQEIDDAKKRNDVVTEERVAMELGAVAAEMDRATGKRGRDRSLANISERARKSVCNAIERTLEEIEDVHKPLWRHLDTNITRGTRLQYHPPEPVDWQL
jgi:hypothetical protein